MTLVVHNSLTNRMEEFKPLNPDKVTMYVCGPTVYGLIHVGNARSVVVFDVLYRVLRNLYSGVCYVRNITDIDDKIIGVAADEGENAADLAVRYAQAFSEDVARLNVLPPTVEPRATEHIQDMLEMVQTLIDKGHAYSVEEHVLFDVASHAPYGELSNRRTSELVEGIRIEVAPFKRNPGDFVLWKPSRQGEPAWDSPWGRGRPGWHIECSAMAGTHLGETIDIHGGGQDLVFPHHENEIAQSRCAHGTGRFANYWLHNGFLTMKGSKMAKSVGNMVLLRNALGQYHGEVVRYALLNGHYRKPLDWSEKLLSEAKLSLDRLYLAVSKAGSVPAGTPPEEFMNCLYDDLNTPMAVALLHKYATALNKEGDVAQCNGMCGSLVASANTIGLLTVEPEQWFRHKRLRGESDLGKDDIAALIAERSEAKRSRNFERADGIRSRLAEAGVLIEDGRDGTTWRWK